MTGFRAVILGCGPSHGVPRIGPDWGACDPGEPKNRRLRCSLLVERRAAGKPPTRVLVDTSPDLRTQLLAAEVDRLDGVVYTHAHADHTHGIDDLRSFWLGDKKRIDVYADGGTLDRLHEAFGYCFRTPPGGSYPPILNAHRIEPGVPFRIDGPSGPVDILPVRQQHGNSDSLGLRFGVFAYSCDVSGLPNDAAAQLMDLDVWIVDALRYAPHPSHFSVDQALGWIERLSPKRAFLTHMHTDLDYATLKARLPAHVEPAFDGMEIAF